MYVSLFVFMVLAITIFFKGLADRVSGLEYIYIRYNRLDFFFNSLSLVVRVVCVQFLLLFLINVIYFIYFFSHFKIVIQITISYPSFQQISQTCSKASPTNNKLSQIQKKGNNLLLNRSINTIKKKTQQKCKSKTSFSPLPLY